MRITRFLIEISDTSELNETIVIRVSAQDLSGNTGYADLTLEPYTSGPDITITSPENNSEWANELTKTVEGYITNSSTDSGISEIDFSTLTVTVASSESSTANPDNLTYSEVDGTFSFSFSTLEISSRQLITVSVQDLNVKQLSGNGIYYRFNGRALYINNIAI